MGFAALNPSYESCCRRFRDRIRRIDTSAAASIAGVVRVVTGRG